MKKVALLLTVLALAGCANLKFQWAASYQTENLAADMRTARAEAAPTESAKP